MRGYGHLYIQPEDTSPTDVALRNVNYTSFEAPDEDGNDLPDHIDDSAL